MSKKPDTASALAGILKARRGDDAAAADPPPVETPEKPEPAVAPSPAPPSPPVSQAPAPPTVERKPRGGKSSDKATYDQFSVYLRKDTRKKVKRALEDKETGQDFSDLVQELLEQWLKSNT